jgi:hypothetical protein
MRIKPVALIALRRLVGKRREVPAFFFLIK